MKYNVLWLDDHFGIPNDPMEILFSSFVSSQKNGRYSLFNVERCQTAAEMKSLISQDECRYQAVILDVFGKSDDQQITDSAKPFFEMLSFLKQRELCVLVFSGELTKDNNRTVIDLFEADGWQEGREYFYKHLGYQRLFKQLQIDLEEKLHRYKPFPELLALFTKGYLHLSDKKRMDQLLDDYNNKNTDTLGKGYIRDLLQSMIETLVYTDGQKEGKKLIDNDLLSPKLRRFGDLFKALSYGRLGREGNHGHPNSFTDPYVPESICPAPIKNAVQYLGNMANLLDHGKDKSEEVFDQPYYSTMMLGIYPSLIEVLRWYYYYMDS